MVVMIREIVKDIGWFLFVLVAFLVGFGVAFFVLLGNVNADDDAADFVQRLDETDGNRSDFGTNFSRLLRNGSDDVLWFRSPWASLLTVFLLMLSDISDIVSVVYDADHIHVGTQVLAFILLCIFLGAVAIVLLNLLIAIMGDSFDRVKNHEKTLYLQRRAEVIQDMEIGLSRRRKKEYKSERFVQVLPHTVCCSSDKIAPYLHILIPNFQGTLQESDWEGRLVDIQRRMREELRDARERGTSDLIQLKRDVKEVKRLLHTITRTTGLQGSTTSYSPHKLSLCRIHILFIRLNLLKNLCNVYKHL